MLQRGLLPDFSDAVLSAMQEIRGPATASDPSIRDLRDLPWFSIDNDDSRDLDQLSAAETRPGNETRVLVAIADVDALVRKASAIDGHAFANTTSVYTAGGIFPMLPERLSTDLTSLGEGVERLAVVADMTVAGDGSVLAGGSDERDMITVPPINDDEREQTQFVSRATLVQIIKPRVEEILEMVRDRLAASAFAGEARGRVVLTGGASQLTGLAELAGRILDRPVRGGRPLGIAALPDSAKGAAFAVAAGLLVYPQAAHLEHFEPRRRRYPKTGTGGYFARVGQWLRESFRWPPETKSLHHIGRWRTGRGRASVAPTQGSRGNHGNQSEHPRYP